MTLQHWISVLENVADRRCDLEILLRDRFRHRVPFRDYPTQCGPVKEREFTLDAGQIGPINLE